MSNLYQRFASVYDECGISEFSIVFGQSMLEHFKQVYPNRSFKRNLDICCGTGKLCNFFKENGIETKGVDLSKEMIDIARENYPEIEFTVSDASEYQDDEKYDFITCTDDALNHITEPDVLKKIIKNVNNLLVDGGLFIFDMNYFYVFNFEKYYKALDSKRKLSYKLTRDDKIIQFNVEYFEDDNLLWKEQVCERDYSVEDITKILNDEGFAVEMFSQHFYNEKRTDKWKVVAKKV